MVADMNKNTFKKRVLNRKIALGISDADTIKLIEKMFGVEVDKEAKMFFYFKGKPISLYTYFNGYGMRIEDASILKELK